MHYAQGYDRDQMMLETWDSMVDPESTARLIDAFVDSLSLANYNVKGLASSSVIVPVSQFLDKCNDIVVSSKPGTYTCYGIGTRANGRIETTSAR